MAKRQISREQLKMALLKVDAERIAALHEIERLRAALEKIRDHWATDYNHPKANAEMYRGPYGIGIVDGHRACAAIARSALTKPEGE